MNFESTHKLAFEEAPCPYDVFSIGYKMFRIGTCEGMWGSTSDCYYIVAVSNNMPGNGHLNDVFEWFENSCKRDDRNLIVMECANRRFYRHLIKKRGFVKLDEGKKNCIKIFNHFQYEVLLAHGNKVIQKGSLNAV